MQNISRFCESCGAPLKPGARFCERCGHGVNQPTYVPPPPPPAYGPPVQGYRPAPPPPRKRGLGCGGCLAIAAAVLVLAVGAAVAAALLYRPVSHNITLGARQAAGSGSVPATGGRFTVTDAASPVRGLTIEVPAGAYPKGTRFDISTQPITDHRLGSLFSPVTPLITIDNGHAFAAQPLAVTIPIHLADDEFALAFYYDRYSGKLEGIPLAALSNDAITVVTSHFSDMAVSKVKKAELARVSIDAGFAPGVDDWQFTNYGTYITPGGQCAGQSITAMWYYCEKRLQGKERPLYGRFDNNNYGYGTIDFEEDDSWGYRFASVVQKSIDWDARSKRLAALAGGLSDTFTWDAFAYAMALTKEPQYVSIGRYYTDAQGKQRRSGHAIVAYKIEGNRLYVADPNYPGVGGRYIQFDGTTLQPYASGANAVDIKAKGVQVYTEIRWAAKSGMVDWDQIGKLYEQMLKGEVGKGDYPAYTIKYAAGIDKVTGQVDWRPLPDVLQLSEEDTAFDEAYRGTLVIGAAMPNNVSARVFRGTEPLNNAAAAGAIGFVAPLKKGVNDLGFYVHGTVDGIDSAIDFKRVKVVYGSEDWSGTWTGTMDIQNIGGARQAVEEMLTRLLVTFGVDEKEARDAARSSIVENPNRTGALTLALQADPESKGARYNARITVTNAEGEPSRYQTTATVKEGRITFSFPDPTSGSVLRFEGQLVDGKRIVGTFSGDLWLVVKNAVSGPWQVTRQGP